MFGYVRPFKGELLVKEYDAYKGVYCEVCKALGENYGIISRFALTYDCTFYAILALNQRESKLRMVKKCCTCNPLKKCKYVCPADGDSYSEECFRKAAALCVITTAFKLIDNSEDEGFLRRTGAKMLYLMLKRSFKKASADYPFIHDAVEKMMNRQREVESMDKPSIDACSAPTAEMLETICDELGENELEKTVLRQIGYFLGRWVYIMDAADDLPKDLKNSRFNPFIDKLELSGQRGSELSEEQRKAADAECNAVLNGSLSRLYPAVNLLPNGRFSGIIDNIVKKGLPEMQREILFLHVNDKKKDRLNEIERNI